MGEIKSSSSMGLRSSDSGSISEEAMADTAKRESEEEKWFVCSVEGSDKILKWSVEQ